VIHELQFRGGPYVCFEQMPDPISSTLNVRLSPTLKTACEAKDQEILQLTTQVSEWRDTRES
jgi:hypothetical protein